jgi:trimethylamine---corrinoid protein Co-methyltransferase
MLWRLEKSSKACFPNDRLRDYRKDSDLLFNRFYRVMEKNMIEHIKCWLTEDEIEKIHQATLEILWERGMKVEHAQGRNLLADAGAVVDGQNHMVRFPADLVERCIETTPGGFAMGGRHGTDVPLGMNSPTAVRSTSGAEGYIGLKSREYRMGTTGDLIEWTRLVDNMQHVDICAGFYPLDVPSDTRDVFTVKTMFENTIKPIFLNPYDVDSFRAIIDMAIAIRGSEAALKERPIVSILTSATSPGVILEYCIDQLILAGKYGVPVEVNAGPVMGGTSPVSIAGTILQNNVEILSLLVISQLANPGTPLIHRGITMAMDMSTGTGLMGAMECALGQAASAQLVKTKYKIPVSSNGPMTDAKISDGQSQIERTILTFLTGLTGTDLLLAPGYIESLYSVDPVQLVIDDEILGNLKRIVRGVDVNDTTLAKDLIKNMPSGSNYLAEMHTVENYRSESHIPEIFNRDARDIWAAEGSRDLNRKAQDRAAHILETCQPEPLSQEIQKELDSIYAAITKQKMEQDKSKH